MRADNALNPSLPPPGTPRYGDVLAQLHAQLQGAPLPTATMAPDAWVGAPAVPVQPAAPAPSGGLGGLFQHLKDLVLRLLHPGPTAGSGPLLRRGMHGEPVRALQNRLKQLGFDPGPLDGDFGPKTAAAVRAFQRREGIEVDGIVGPETWRHLGIDVRGSVSYGPPTAGVPVPISGAPNEVAQRFIDNAKRFLGIPYLYGGGHSGYMTKPGRVDCSGLVLQAAHMAGFNLDGCAADQQRMGRPVSMRDLKPGDLVFRGMPAHHVGIYIGNGQVIHAPQTGDVVKISPVSYFENARRVIG